MKVAIFILTFSLASGEQRNETAPRPAGKGVWDFITGNGPRFCNCICGQSNPTSRLLGGQFVTPHEYPWLALVYLQGNRAVGGVLINDLYVLTSANHLKGLTPYDLKVSVGEYNRCFDDNTASNVTVDAIRLHPDFDPETRSHDIALIRLSNSVVMDRWVSPICLPRPGANYHENVAHVIGWGEAPDAEGNAVNSCRPRKMGLPVLEDRECLLGSPTSSLFTRDKGCAGLLGSGSTVCATDSGGPVQYHNPDGTYELIGIISDSNACRDSGAPAVFTRVNQHFPWLFQYTRDSCYCGK